MDFPIARFFMIVMQSSASADNWSRSLCLEEKL